MWSQCGEDMFLFFKYRILSPLIISTFLKISTFCCLTKICLLWVGNVCKIFHAFWSDYFIFKNFVLNEFCESRRLENSLMLTSYLLFSVWCFIWRQYRVSRNGRELLILLFDFYQTVKFERTLSIFLIFAATSFRVWVALKFAFISSNNSEKPSSFGRFLFKIWGFSRLSILFIELSNVTGGGRAKFLKIEKSKSAFISSKLSRRRDSFLQIWSSGLNSILGTVKIRKLGVLQGLP